MFIVKGGIVILASLAILRVILHDILNLKDDLTRKRRRR
jgi:hypothetical protein